MYLILFLTKIVKLNSTNAIAYVFTVSINEDVRLHNKNNPNDLWEEITRIRKEELLQRNLEIGTL